MDSVVFHKSLEIARRLIKSHSTSRSQLEFSLRGQENKILLWLCIWILIVKNARQVEVFSLLYAYGVVLLINCFPN